MDLKQLTQRVKDMMGRRGSSQGAQQNGGDMRSTGAGDGAQTNPSPGDPATSGSEQYGQQQGGYGQDAPQQQSGSDAPQQQAGGSEQSFGGSEEESGGGTASSQ